MATHVFNMKVDAIIQAVRKIRYRLDIYFKKRINAGNLSYILTDIYLVATILGDKDWSPDYVNKIEEALKVTQEQNSQSSSQNSSPCSSHF